MPLQTRKRRLLLLAFRSEEEGSTVSQPLGAAESARRTGLGKRRPRPPPSATPCGQAGSAIATGSSASTTPAAAAASASWKRRATSWIPFGRAARQAQQVDPDDVAHVVEEVAGRVDVEVLVEVERARFHTRDGRDDQGVLLHRLALSRSRRSTRRASTWRRCHRLRLDAPAVAVGDQAVPLQERRVEQLGVPTSSAHSSGARAAFGILPRPCCTGCFRRADAVELAFDLGSTIAPSRGATSGSSQTAVPAGWGGRRDGKAGRIAWVRPSGAR